MPASIREALEKLKVFEGVDLNVVEQELAGREVRELAVGDVLLSMGD
jgi:hypothetical protein